MGLAEFLIYGEAYLIKLIAPALVPFMIAAIAQKLSADTKGTVDSEKRGIIDESMSGLAKNFSIACPNCEQINWYPASGKKPKQLKAKTTRL